MPNDANDIHLNLKETTINGPKTKRWVLEAGDCAMLAVHRIARLGIEEAVAPYQRVRVRPEGSFVMALCEGEGRILLDGRWQIIRANNICMAPPRVLNAFHARPPGRWVFAWVRYEEPVFVKPLVSAASPVRLRCDTQPLCAMFEGLRAEWDGQRDLKLVHHWIELLHASVRRLAQPWHMNERLWSFWTEVSGDLAAPWTLQELARRYHSSREQLRRLCISELGRSPMEHLSCLRLERAQELLGATDDKVEVIAEAVGYQSAQVFSRAFKRWVGYSPSQFRERGKTSVPSPRRGDSAPFTGKSSPQ